MKRSVQHGTCHTSTGRRLVTVLPGRLWAGKPVLPEHMWANCEGLRVAVHVNDKSGVSIGDSLE
jgi:G3E family GTPase